MTPGFVRKKGLFKIHKTGQRIAGGERPFTLKGKFYYFTLCGLNYGNDDYPLLFNWETKEPLMSEAETWDSCRNCVRSMEKRMRDEDFKYFVSMS